MEQERDIIPEYIRESRDVDTVQRHLGNIWQNSESLPFALEPRFLSFAELSLSLGLFLSLTRNKRTNAHTLTHEHINLSEIFQCGDLSGKCKI